MRYNQSSVTTFPPLIIIILLLSITFGLYLSMSTQMTIVNDSIAYAKLGQMIYAHGWISYFKTGPNREPLYPLLIAVSMGLGNVTGLAFTQIMAVFGVVIMFWTQVLSYLLLRLLNIRNSTSAIVLSYLCLSPVLNNSTFRLYSEIITYPIILSIILVSIYWWKAIKNDNKTISLYLSILLGAVLASVCFIKDIFEFIVPVYLIILFSTALLKNKKTISLFICILSTVILYETPIIYDKYMNLHYNGNFVLTDRGSQHLYSKTIQRMEPLNLKRFTEIVSFVPGASVCNHFFTNSECDSQRFYTSEMMASTKIKELQHKNLPIQQMNTTLINLSIQKALQNSFQYILLASIEGLKMFFWEHTAAIHGVIYPRWLQDIYYNPTLTDVMGFILSLLTCFAVLHLWIEALKPQDSPLIFLIGSLIFLFIFFHCFVSIVSRFVLPIVPLYLIAIAFWLDKKLIFKK